MIEIRCTRRPLCAGTGLLIAVLTGLLPHGARAQTPPTADATAARDQDARRLFEAGREAYVDEKYQDALNYFQQSHELSGRPQLLFNVGQAADRLGQSERAAEAFRGYLAAVPDAGNRAEVEARIAELDAAQAERESQVTSGIPDLPDGHHHPRDGLYLRGALGGGGFTDDLRPDGIGPNAVASGVTFALELAIGMPLKPGLALAGFVAIEWAQTREVRVGGLAVDNTTVGALGMIGGMADWYLNPDQGWHLQGGLALARITVQGNDNEVESQTPVGGAILLGGGYEWSLARGWSLGALLRLTGTQLKGDGYTHNFVAVSLLCSVTMF